MAVGIIFVGPLSSELLSLVVFYGPRHILGLTSLLLLGFQWKGKNQCEIFVASFDDRDHGYPGTWKLMETFSYCISAVDKKVVEFFSEMASYDLPTPFDFWAVSWFCIIHLMLFFLM